MPAHPLVFPLPCSSMPPLRLITTFGLGFMRPASGTWGSLPPPIVDVALYFGGYGPGQHPWVFNGVMLAIMLLFAFACVKDGDDAERRWGHDPKEVVADETAGQCLPLLLLPASSMADVPTALFTIQLAFLAFRAMDIAKPWPCMRLQRIPGGWGILLDDLVAGLYAAAIVQIAAAVGLG